jgi:acetylornithine deacetylase
MNAFELTRALIDIESVTPNEERVGDYLFDYLSKLAARTNGRVEKIQVEPQRNNILATWGDPIVTLSTHIDTVPPFFESREDATHIWGRGACDTKGIIASMIFATEALLASGMRGIALLFVVGEERNINGEPTENKLALGSKGALRFEIIASGRMAHSAYPHLGESAIEKLLDALQKIRRIPMPRDPALGASTMNIGTIKGGRAPNVIPDDARAEIFYRLVDSGDSLIAATLEATRGLAEAKQVLIIPAVHLGTMDGFETAVMAYTTDIPAFEGAWGKPYLIGPGSIHVAHTSEERIPKAEITEAIDIYQRLVRRLIQA